MLEIERDGMFCFTYIFLLLFCVLFFAPVPVTSYFVAFFFLCVALWRLFLLSQPASFQRITKLILL